jgi:plastocyanin
MTSNKIILSFKSLVAALVLLCSLMIPKLSWGGMMMDEHGMVMNANADNLPKDCQQISENVDITIRAGRDYATKFKGKMFSYDQQEWNVAPCAKINVTFINEDHIRHQLMVHGLPGYLYPEGMVHLELYGQGQLSASFIVPGQKKTYLVHCELAQHAEKGMKSQLKVGGGDGDLPSISAISAPIKEDPYSMDMSLIKWGIVIIFIVVVLIMKVGNWVFSRYLNSD